MGESDRVMQTASEFAAEVRARFSWLVADYGFRSRPPLVCALENGESEWLPLGAVTDGPLQVRSVRVEFETDAVVVHVTHDPNSEQSVQLTSRLLPEPSRVDLWHVMSFVRAPELDQPAWRGKWGAINQARDLGVLAGALKRYAGPWLAADAQHWKDLLSWWAGGMQPRERSA